LAPFGDHDPVYAVAERDDGESACRRPQHARAYIAWLGESDIAEAGHRGWRGAGELDAGLLADQAAGAVASDQVAGGQPVRSVGAADVDGHLLLVLRQADELVTAADLRAEFQGPFLQHLLDLRLPGR
jgi:hypothetical protein